jgi:DNA-binding response OmpR family regulator
MPLKVYYVEDEVELCEIFTAFFSSKEIEVTTYTDPFVALEVSKTNPPDIFFTDYRLPGINGDQLAMLMAAEIPKYLITGEFDVQTDYKFEKIFNKPYKAADIREILKKKLEGLPK